MHHKWECLHFSSLFCFLSALASALGSQRQGRALLQVRHDWRMSTTGGELDMQGCV